MADAEPNVTYEVAPDPIHTLALRDVALNQGLDEVAAAKVAGDSFHEMVAIVEDEMRAAEVELFREERPHWLDPEVLWWRPPGEWEFPAEAEGDAVPA